MLGLIELAAEIVGVPAALLAAICSVESDFRNVVNLHDGGSPSYGQCQIKLETAKFLGFSGTAPLLMDPATNVYYAALYLKFQLERSRGDICAATSAYNMGKTKYQKNGKYKNPSYVRKVLSRREKYARTVYEGTEALAAWQQRQCDLGVYGWTLEAS